jgi:hypothetical protein
MILGKKKNAVVSLFDAILFGVHGVCVRVSLASEQVKDVVAGSSLADREGSEPQPLVP